jgi:hypothetical protein
MPMILKNVQRRRAFLFGRAHALRSTSDVIDQLQDQLEAGAQEKSRLVARSWSTRAAS